MQIDAATPSLPYSDKTNEYTILYGEQEQNYFNHCNRIDPVAYLFVKIKLTENLNIYQQTLISKCIQNRIH